MIVIVYKAVFLKLFQTKDHLANKKKCADHLTKYPRNNMPPTQTWRQTIVSGKRFSRVGSPFLHTDRLVIDMTMRQAKHLEACSMRDLVMLQTIVRSQPHTPITHSDRHHKTQRCAYRSISLPTVG